MMNGYNSSTGIQKIIKTTQFQDGITTLRKNNRKDVLVKLRDIIDDLCTFDAGSRYHNHRLKNSELCDIHVMDEIILLYRYVTDKVLAIDLELADIGKHDVMLNPKNLGTHKKRIQSSYDFGGDNMSVFSDEYFTKEEVDEFCYDLEDDLSAHFGLSVVTYDSYVENTIHFHIAMDVDDGYIIETDFTVDFRKIKKPNDLYKYYQPAYDDLAEQIEEYVHESF